MATISRNNTIYYRGMSIGNVEISLKGDDVGTAVIDGRTRKVVFRVRTQGKLKGTKQWHCDDQG